MQVICVVGFIDADALKKITPERMKAEADYVRSLYAQDIVRQVWSKAGGGGALLMLEVPSEGEAVRLMSGLPFVKDGLLRIEQTYSLAPYRGFGSAS
ncbi:hypothetical protein [Roseateles noduli]|uniref:hypothetical protein n=1 Tax=Roseateles noduli TaxID=2052484 RepID=UPI003D661D6E